MQKSTSCDDDADADCDVVDHIASVSSMADQPDEHAAIDENGDKEDADEQDDRVPELLANMDVDQPTVALPPDGGWGWVVVAAAFFVNLIVDGVAYTFGVIMPELLDHFEAGKGQTVLVGSLIPGVYLIVGKKKIVSFTSKTRHKYSIMLALC